jgi:hypothetical protein
MQLCALCIRFDAFRCHLHAERMRKRDDRLHNRGVFRVGAKTGIETSVRSEQASVPL